MIEILLKYDNMHIIGVINALNCINNHIITCINSMLSALTSLLSARPSTHLGKCYSTYQDVVPCACMCDEAFYAVVRTHKRRSKKNYNSEMSKI